jgi:hypothetical protein
MSPAPINMVLVTPMPLTVTVRCLLLAAPSLSVTIRDAVYVPGAGYVWIGVLFVAMVPSPNAQAHDTTLPSATVDRSVNVASSWSVVNPKSAVGGWLPLPQDSVVTRTQSTSLMAGPRRIQTPTKPAPRGEESVASMDQLAGSGVSAAHSFTRRVPPSTLTRCHTHVPTGNGFDMVARAVDTPPL